MHRSESPSKKPCPFTAAALLCLLLAGCQTLPDIRGMARAFPYHGQSPVIVDSRGPLRAEGSRLLYDRLLPGGRSDSMLGRHTVFLQALTGCPVIAGNDVVLLYNGPETFSFMGNAIRNARDHINSETFIFTNDEAGLFFSDLFIEKSREGVAVNVIYDAMGGRFTPDAFYETMRAFGVNVLKYNPVTVSSLESGAVNQRDHRKILIVDGRSVFTGGINYYHKVSEITGRSGRTFFRDWRDTDVRIEGPAVAEFQNLFLETWKNQKGTGLTQRNFYPLLSEKGDLLVQVLTDGPDQKIPSIYAAYMSAFFHAKKSIHLTHSYIVPPEDMLKALEDAARSGVEVKIIVPSFSDFWLPLYAGRSNYTRLLKAGVRLYEIQKVMLHAKTAVIDGVWSTVGSANLIPRSFVGDLEVNAVVLGPRFGSEMEALFQSDLSRTKEIRLEEWENRPLGEHILEWLSQLFRFVL